jgi:predicted tellurium resistance membrane protein TerC
VLGKGDVEVSHRNLAIGTIVFLVSILGLVMLFAMTSVLQAVNPLAAVTALTVALIGIVWFKKASNQKLHKAAERRTSYLKR